MHAEKLDPNSRNSATNIQNRMCTFKVGWALARSDFKIYIGSFYWLSLFHCCAAWKSCRGGFVAKLIDKLLTGDNSCLLFYLQLLLLTRPNIFQSWSSKISRQWNFIKFEYKSIADFGAYFRASERVTSLDDFYSAGKNLWIFCMWGFLNLWNARSAKDSLFLSRRNWRILCGSTFHNFEAPKSIAADVSDVHKILISKILRL